MRLILIILLACPVLTYAQDGFLIFSVVDTNASVITNGSNDWKLKAMPQVEDMPALNIESIGSSNILYVKVPRNLLGEKLHLTIVQYKGGPDERKMQIEWKSANANLSQSCYRCMLNTFVFEEGNFTLDLPLQKESWDMLPVKTMLAGGSTIECIDISMLQSMLLFSTYTR